MNPLQIYQQQQDISLTRIDLLLALYDKAIGHLAQAQQVLEQQDYATATPLLLQAQLIVYALATGVDTQYGELPRNMLRLYEFVLYCLGCAEAEKVRDALRLLLILREGFGEIQQPARNLELSGKIPPVKSLPALRLSA